MLRSCRTKMGSRKPVLLITLCCSRSLEDPLISLRSDKTVQEIPRVWITGRELSNANGNRYVITSIRIFSLLNRILAVTFPIRCAHVDDSRVTIEL